MNNNRMSLGRIDRGIKMPNYSFINLIKIFIVKNQEV